MKYRVAFFDTIIDLRDFLNAKELSRNNIIHISVREKTINRYELLYLEDDDE